MSVLFAFGHNLLEIVLHPVSLATNDLEKTLLTAENISLPPKQTSPRVEFRRRVGFLPNDPSRNLEIPPTDDRSHSAYRLINGEYIHAASLLSEHARGSQPELQVSEMSSSTSPS